MIARHILDGRRAAERVMTSTVQIGTVTDGMDPDTGDAIEVIDAVWEGKARIHTRTVASQAMSGPGVVYAVQDLVLTLPVPGTGRIRTGMAVKVVTNPLDPDLVGVSYRIAGTSGESQQVARRFQIERTH